MKRLPETVIHYLSVLPGSGKTHWIEISILRWLEAYHANEDEDARKTRVTIFCAPTYRLLNQVHDSLREKSTAAGLFTEQEADDYIYAITDEARNTLRKVTMNREISIALGAKPRPGTDEEGLPALKPGSVVLITHEAFSHLPSGQQWTSDVSVYFDEMRACAMEPSNIALTSEQVVNIFGTDAQFLDPALAPDAKGFARVRALNEAPERIDAMFKDKSIRFQSAGRTRLSRAALIRLVEASWSARAHVYMRMSKDNLQNPTPDILSDLVHVTVPMDMFFGYRRVVLASAWIEESQMFYLLNRDSRVRMVNLLDGSDPELRQQMKSSPRAQRLKDRLDEMYIIPLTQEEKPLSRTRMERGVLISLSAFDKLKGIARGKTFKIDRNTLGDLEAYARTGFANSSRRPKNISKAYTQYLDKFVELARTTQVNTTPSNPDQLHTRPLSWFIQTAGEILHRFTNISDENWRLKTSGETDKLSLLVFNQPKEGYAAATRGKEKGKAWMDGVHWRYYEAETMDLAPVSSKFQEISSYSHGLNEFKGYNAITFLSALNPTPLMASFIKEYFNSRTAHIPYVKKSAVPFDISKDMLISACAQSVARTSIRDIRSTNRVIVIVPDVFTAEHLKTAFGGRPTVMGDPGEVPGMEHEPRFVWPSTWNAFMGESGDETNFTSSQKAEQIAKKAAARAEVEQHRKLRQKDSNRETTAERMRRLRAERAADPRFKDIKRLSERLMKMSKQSTLSSEQVKEFNATLKRVNTLRAETGSRPAKYQPLPVNAPAPRRSTV